MFHQKFTGLTLHPGPLTTGPKGSTKSILTTRRAMVRLPAIGKRETPASRRGYPPLFPHRFFAYSGRVFLFSSPPFVFLPSFLRRKRKLSLAPPSFPPSLAVMAGWTKANRQRGTEYQKGVTVACNMGIIAHPPFNPSCINEQRSSFKFKTCSCRRGHTRPPMPAVSVPMQKVISVLNGCSTTQKVPPPPPPIAVGAVMEGVREWGTSLFN